MLLVITGYDFIASLVVTKPNECLGYVQGIDHIQSADRSQGYCASGSRNWCCSCIFDDVKKHKWPPLRMVWGDCEDVCSCGYDTISSQKVETTSLQRIQRLCDILPTLLIYHIGRPHVDRRGEQVQLSSLSCLVPSVLVKLSKAEIKTNLAKLTEQYNEDVPWAPSMSSQLHSWSMKWEAHMKQYGVACLPTTSAMTLPNACTLFSNIRALLVIVCILPVSSC